MKKKIRQVTGTTVGVTFTNDEQKIYGIEVGGVADLSDAIFYKQNQAEENLKDCIAKQNNPKRIKELKRRLKNEQLSKFKGGKKWQS